MAEAAEAKAIEIKLDNGMVIKGATPEEALQSAAKIIEDNVKFARESKAQLETLNTQLTSLQQQVQQQQKPPEPTKGFNKDEYFRRFADDPDAANSYWFEQRFGASPQDVAQRFDRIDNSIDVIEGERLAAQFLQQHADDFPADATNAAAIRKEVESLTKQGYPATLQTMNIAYESLIDRGVIKPLEVPQEREEAPPQLPGGGSVQVMPDQEFNKLSTADMEKYLRAQGRI